MKITKVACVGTGVIGSGFATNYALKGKFVNVYDIKDELFDLAKNRIEENLEYLAKNEVIKFEEIQEILNRISYTTSIEEAVKDVQFIQESGPEKYEIKQEILAQVEKYAPENAIFASSTSNLMISEIAKYAKHPERCIGGHPYNPPHLIPLIEITKGKNTSEEVVEIAKDFYEEVGKVPVVLQKEVPGFLCNRIQGIVMREYAYLVMNGVCTVEDMDKAICFGPGLRWGIMGPGLVFELGGGEYGIKGVFDNIGSGDVLKTACTWLETPKEWSTIAQEGVNEELKNRSPEIGNDRASLKKYRDDMLISLLKMHKKI